MRRIFGVQGLLKRNTVGKVGSVVGIGIGIGIYFVLVG